MTAKRKQDAVKQVDRGEPIDLVARSLGVSAAGQSTAQEGGGALKDGECDGRDLQIKELQSNVSELTMILDLRDEKIERLETGCPLVRLESGR